jgi:hypothetical protein
VCGRKAWQRLTTRQNRARKGTFLVFSTTYRTSNQHSLSSFHSTRGSFLLGSWGNATTTDRRRW